MTRSLVEFADKVEKTPCPVCELPVRLEVDKGLAAGIMKTTIVRWLSQELGKPISRYWLEKHQREHCG